MRLTPYVFIFSVALWTSCSTAKKSFEKGDYETAIERAVKKLRSKPYNEKAKSALIDGYWLYFNQLDQGIADLKRTDKKFKWEEIASKYDKLNRSYALIQSCPACKEAVGYAKNYPKESEEAKQKAANERFVAGELSLKEDTRLSAKKAYFHFEKTKFYSPNYEGIDQWMAKAKERATIKVLVSNTSGKTTRSNYYFDRVYEGILNANRNQFIAFYEDNVTDPHHKLEITLDYFKMNQAETIKTREEIQSDSLVIGTVREDSISREVMGVVFADLTTFEKKASAEGRGTVKVVDLSTGQTLSLKSYPEVHKWNDFWAIFSGDKRALSEDQYELTQVTEPSTPSSQYFFNEVSKGLGNRLSTHIQQFYKDY